MLLVFPEYRNQGIGQQLLQGARHLLHDVETVKLDATPAGRVVYLRNTFQDEYDITRFVGGRIRSPQGQTLCEPIEKAADLPGISMLDQTAFGADRLALLQWLVSSAPELAFLKREGGKVIAYCLGRRGFLYNHIGPIIAATVDNAIDLVAAALAQCDDRPVVIDVPRTHETWVRWLTARGFAPLREFTRMFIGTNRMPGHPSRQFAVAGPEFG
jgi:ribosomal protein S18 acetylase RimI-like enzyme